MSHNKPRGVNSSKAAKKRNGTVKKVAVKKDNKKVEKVISPVEKKQ